MLFVVAVVPVPVALLARGAQEEVGIPTGAVAWHCVVVADPVADVVVLENSLSSANSLILIFA